MSDPLAFFELEGDQLRPTILTRGPWRPEHQHGGPPAALMARAIEGALEADSFQLARFTIDFLRPVPIAALLTVRVERVRDGRRARGYAAVLWAGEEAVARATALALRTERAVSAPEPEHERLLPLPDEAEPFRFPFFRATIGYHTAVESRLARGTIGAGRAAAWMRQRVPLVRGETPSPAQRLLVMADSGSGVGAVLDQVRVVPFINADLNVSLHRLPDGEWIGLDSVTTLEPHGVGLTRTGLYDVHGAVGEGLQALVAGRMGPH
jgi:Thioesterase-like superfamily